MIRPQLLSELNISGLSNLIKSEHFAMSQKLDGRRLMVEISDLKISGWARSGLEADIPECIMSDFSRVRSNWTFDGELVDKTYHVFDLIKYPGGDLRKNRWEDRQEILNAVLTGFSDHIKIVKQSVDPTRKQQFFDACFESKVEGVVFCETSSTYLMGMRSSRCLKYKFKKTIDCVIVDKSLDSKDNLVLGVYDDNQNLINIGKVSALTGDGRHHEFQIGEVVTVEYLYATKANRLYQPVKPKLRKDKGAKECSITQMIHKGTEIL